MFNKKIGLLVLACAAMGLASCNQGGNDPKSSAPANTDPGTSQQGEGGGEEAKIPSVEGKIGVYFEFEDTEQVKLEEFPAYVGIYITGAWNTSYFSAASDDPMTGAVEMERLNDSRIFYTYLPGDADLGDLGYQIALGYGKNSGLGAADLGLSWDYKTVFSSENYGGLDHPFMTKEADNLYVCKSNVEGSPMGFKDVLPPPVKLYDIWVDFTLDAAVEEHLAANANLEVAIKGAYDGWGSAKTVNKGDDNKYHFQIADAEKGIIAGDISMCIGIRNKVTMAGTMDDKYNLELKTGVDAVDGKEKAIKGEDEQIVKYQLDNILVSLISIYGDHHHYEIGTLGTPEHANGTLDAFAFPSNDLPALENDIHINLTHTGEAALAADAPVSIAGTITEWGHNAMTMVEEGRSWTYTLSKDGLFVGNEIKFKFTMGAWDWEVAPNADLNMGNDFVVVLEAGKTNINVAADMTGWATANAGDAKYVKCSSFEYVADKMGMDVTILVINDAATAEAAPCIAGSINGWAHEAMTKAENVEEYTYVIDADEMYVGTKIEFLVTPGNWDNKISAEGGANIAVTLKAGFNLIRIHADLSANNSATSAYASLEYVQALQA